MHGHHDATEEGQRTGQPDAAVPREASSWMSRLGDNRALRRSPASPAIAAEDPLYMKDPWRTDGDSGRGGAEKEAHFARDMERPQVPASSATGGTTSWLTKLGDDRAAVQRRAATASDVAVQRPRPSEPAATASEVQQKSSRWTCRECGETNNEAREHCNNCGRQRPCVMAERWFGMVKRFDNEKGFGFISCAKAAQQYNGGDVFLHKKMLPWVAGMSQACRGEELVGAKVSFLVQDWQGRPQARELRVEEPAPSHPAQGGVQRPSRLCPEVDTSTLSPDKRFFGVVKSFDDSTGYGFISCDELRAVFGRDVFLHKSQRYKFNAGDSVWFKVDVDPVKGAPRARDLESSQDMVGIAAANGFAALAGFAATGGALNMTEVSTTASQESAASAVTPDESCSSPAPNSSVLWLGDSPDAPNSSSHPAASPEALRQESLPVQDPHQDTQTGPAESIPSTVVQEPIEESEKIWQKFATDDGRGNWWWLSDSDFFFECDPEPWKKYQDPVTQRCYWWKEDGHWFWEHSGRSAF